MANPVENVIVNALIGAIKKNPKLILSLIQKVVDHFVANPGVFDEVIAAIEKEIA